MDEKQWEQFLAPYRQAVEEPESEAERDPDPLRIRGRAFAD